MTFSLTPSAAVRELTRVGTDPDHIRGAFGRFPSGVAALCAQIDDVNVGMVASSFTVGVSYSPPMVMFAVQNSSTTWPVLSRAARIGVSILGHDQSEACMQLASRRRDRFEGLPISVTPTGAVLIHEALMWLECDVVATTPAGDHQVVVMEVHEMSVEDDRVPLVYHARGFHSLHALG